MGIKKIFGDLFFGDYADYTPDKMTYIQVTIPAQAGWHTIARSPYFWGDIDIRWNGSNGGSNFAGYVNLSPVFYWVGANCNPHIVQNQYMKFAAGAYGLTKARLVYHQSTGGQIAELQVWNNSANELILDINSRLCHGRRNTLLDTPISGTIPSGFKAGSELDFLSGFSTTEQVYGKTLSNGTFYTFNSYLTQSSGVNSRTQAFTLPMPGSWLVNIKTNNGSADHQCMNTLIMHFSAASTYGQSGQSSLLYTQSSTGGGILNGNPAMTISSINNAGTFNVTFNLTHTLSNFHFWLGATRINL